MTLHVAIMTDQYPSIKHPDRGTFIRDLVDQLRSAKVDVAVIDHKTNFAAMSVECMIRSALVDVVDAQFLAPAGVIASITPKAAPLVITIHRWDILEFPHRWPLAEMATSYALRAARGIITVGSAVLPEVMKYAPSNAKISTIPNAVDAWRFRPDVDFRNVRDQLGIADREKVILSIGHLIPRKGFEYLIRAMAIIERKYEQCCLVIVGDGYLRNELETLKTWLHLNTRIKFVGGVNSDDLPCYYSMADIFVLPSLSEGHSVAILEAMASGKPIVASAIAANTSTVTDGWNGFLVRPRDPNALAESILRLLREDDLREVFGRNSRHRALRDFNWSDRISRLKDFYSSIAV